MSKKKKTYIWLIAIAVLIVAIVAISIARHGRSQVVVNSQPVTRGSIETTVTATGEIQPVYKVEVGTQVSGIIEKLYVDYNSTVTKGQLLAELDKSLLQEQVKQAQANLSTTTSNKQLAEKNYNRIKSLYDKKAATQEEYDQAETNLAQANNQLITAQSDYDRARTNLKYAEIYSPIDGVVLSKAVEEGQTVASAYSTPTLFTIAKNLTDMQLEAKIDEADIGLVKTGQKVRFSVDAFPADQFSGTVRQIRLVPTVVSNVVTYTVIIDAPNDNGKLYPGMTATITILVEEEEGLTMPLEAANFALTPQLRQQLLDDGYTITDLDSTPSTAYVYVVDGRKLEARSIETGLTDGVNAIAKSGLTEGDQVVRSIAIEKKSPNQERESPLHIGPANH
ncbi:MAG: efflux RND transporter periplasmic adaptor subunit [Bacteroidales bacterium]|nr:efflux RND transporter periplasmic adaptor subunit [Bacteroidales bacterium]